MIKCPGCGADALEIDVKCSKCGYALGATGAHRMLGQVMLGVYELVDVLGQGGMSVVFKGRHKLTDQEVALKILPPELAAHSQVKSRFLEEAKALAALDHPNIVHLYNFGQENGFFVLAMQYVQGQTWERMIIEGKRLDWITSARIAIDVLRALEYAHGRGIVHRDMKPSNVLVRAHDSAATVMDFGIAKMAASTRLTAEGQTMGTVRYMSPEQVRGHEVTLHTDIYSLGATLYESLVGDTPFDGQTHFEIMTKHLSEVPRRPSTHGIELPSDVEDALMRSLAKKAEDRWETARDMRKVLEAALRRADAGLIDTQQLSVADVAAARRTPMPASAGRPSTATPLSDMLEPGESSARLTAPDKPSKLARSAKRSLAPWIVVGVAVVGLGTATAVVLLKKPRAAAKGAGAGSSVVIDGVTIAETRRFDKLEIETAGKISVDELDAGYRAALIDIQKAAAKVTLDGKGTLPKVRLEVHAPAIDTLIALPQLALCATSAYPMGSPPFDCRTTLATVAVGNHGDKRLMVADDRASLPRALAMGIAKAVCDFPADADKARATEICEIQKQFADDK